jgi:hypothetical protein
LLEEDMSSVVEICNLALARVGQPPIVNIDDGDRLSRLCKLHYEPKRDDLLRQYRWKFAIKRQEVPASATPPVFGYANAYTLPSDCLRVLSINELDPEFDPDLDPSLWDREGNKIVTDEGPPLSVRYIRRVIDPKEFDPSFSNCLSAWLAYFFIPSLREVEVGISQGLLEEFDFFVSRAKSISSIESRPRLRRHSRSNWVHGYRW